MLGNTSHRRRLAYGVFCLESALEYDGLDFLDWMSPQCCLQHIILRTVSQLAFRGIFRRLYIHKGQIVVQGQVVNLTNDEASR